MTFVCFLYPRPDFPTKIHRDWLLVLGSCITFSAELEENNIFPKSACTRGRTRTGTGIWMPIGF